MGSHDHGSHVLEEPKTPLWLPALGAFLFLLAGIWWGSRAPDPTPEPAQAEPAPEQAAPAQTAPAPAQTAKPGRPAVDADAGHGH